MECPRDGVGYVTRFDVRKAYLDQFPVRQAGGRQVLEYWIPAEELRELLALVDSLDKKTKSKKQPGE